jgi:hypothetical protein
VGQGIKVKKSKMSNDEQQIEECPPQYNHLTHPHSPLSSRPGGHCCVLHSSRSWLSCALHSSPPLLPSLSIVLVLDFCPPLQDCEHWDQGDQEDQVQSTGDRDYFSLYFI